MIAKRIVLFALFLALIPLSADANPATPAEGLSKENPYPVWWAERMIEHYEASQVVSRPEARVWQGDSQPTVVSMNAGQKNAVVALLMSSYYGYQPFCTATIINNQYVLSAAHCVHQCDDNGYNCQDVPASYIKIGVGDNMSNPQQTLSVNSVVYNPQYTGQLDQTTGYYDVSVLRLSSPVSTSSIEPIPINTQALTYQFAGTECQAGGYGRTHLSDNNTQKYWAGLNVQYVYELDIYVKDSGNVQGVCQGDSGGPLIYNFGNGPVVVGTVSWGSAYSCVDTTAYSRVDTKQSWILANSGGGTDCSNACQGMDCGYDGACNCGGCQNGYICQSNQCVEDSTPDPCQGVDYYGCCDGSVLKYCYNEQLQMNDCGANGCGWRSSDYGYDCGFSGADPSGEHPIDCGGEPDCLSICAGADCGSVQGCNCGSCGSGEECRSNHCVELPPDCDTICGNLQCGSVGECDCGDCGADEVCRNNQCVEDNPGCDIICSGLQCGLRQGCSCGICPGGEECINHQCVGDTPTDGDVSCEGACSPLENDVCVGDGYNICTCRDLQWTQVNCAQSCMAQGKNYLSCGLDLKIGSDACLCEGGNSSDGDETPSDGDETTLPNVEPPDGDDGGSGSGATDSGCNGAGSASSSALLLLLMLAAGLRRRFPRLR